ncbi:MAG: hypothetical protein IJ551_09365 [Prevotella sp.]|nr:hypothetical protein [Prevotella sp.]
MHLIEPCCTQRHWPALRNQLGEDGTEFFHGYGDLSLAELLPVILIRYEEVDMILVAPSLPDTAAETLRYWLRRQLVKMDGSGKVNTLAHLTLIADLSEKRSPLASTWLKENPFGDRLTLRNVQQNDTAILLPDLALYGPINLTYGHHFTAMATKNARTIAALRSEYERLLR